MSRLNIVISRRKKLYSYVSITRIYNTRNENWCINIVYVRVYVRIYKCKKFCWFRKRCILAYFVTCSLIINYVIVISWRTLTKSESSRWYVFRNSMFYYRYAIVHSHNSWLLFEFHLEYDNEEELFSNSHCQSDT